VKLLVEGGGQVGLIRWRIDIPRIASLQKDERAGVEMRSLEDPAAPVAVGAAAPEDPLGDAVQPLRRLGLDFRERDVGAVDEPAQGVLARQPGMEPGKRVLFRIPQLAADDAVEVDVGVVRLESGKRHGTEEEQADEAIPKRFRHAVAERCSECPNLVRQLVDLHAR
jgi:hypothetical protein